MKLKFLIGALLVVSISQLYAQEIVKQDFSTTEIISYAQLRKEILNNPFDIVTSMQKNVQFIDISQSRMSEILENSFTGKETKTTVKEKKELQKLQDLMNKDLLVHQKKMAKVLAKKNNSLSRYKEFKERYHSDHTFQKTVNQIINN